MTAREVLEAERAQDTSINEGDILLVYVGRDAHRERHPPQGGGYPRLAGLAPDCIPLLHERRIAVLGADGVNDPSPAATPVEDWPIPVHMCGLVAMGLHLLDNLYLADLAAACAAANRWEFFFTLAPLRIERGTGSPVNPIAIL